MNKITLSTLALCALTVGACTSSPTSLPPGKYESSSTSTNARGTETSTDKTTYVYKDADGNKKAVQKTETSTDPKGLFNKEKTTHTKFYE